MRKCSTTDIADHALVTANCYFAIVVIAAT